MTEGQARWWDGWSGNLEPFLLAADRLALGIGSVSVQRSHPFSGVGIALAN